MKHIREILNVKWLLDVDSKKRVCRCETVRESN